MRCSLLVLTVLFATGCEPADGDPPDDDDAADDDDGADDDDTVNDDDTNNDDDSADDDDTVNDDDSADDDPAGPVVAVSAVFGPAGGELELADGTTLVIPAGALLSDLEVSATPVPAEPDLAGGGFVSWGSAYMIEPPIESAGDPFLLRIDAPDPAELATDAGVEEVLLVAASVGIVDGDEEALEELVAPLWPVDTVDGDVLVFGMPALPDGTTFHPVIPEYELSEERDHLIPGLLIGHTCAEVITAVGGNAPTDIDWVIGLTTSPLLNDYQQYQAGLSTADFATLVDNTNRLIARACVGLYRAEAYYRGVMGLSMPRIGWLNPRIPLAVRWEYPTSATTAYAGANGNGTFVYVSPWHLSVPGYLGSQGIWNPPSSGPVDESVGQVESSMAHEAWHYLEDWANGVPGDNVLGFANLPGANPNHRVLSEGGAETSSEMVFDETPDVRSMPNILEWSLWGFSYQGDWFWRFLDWEQDSGAPADSIVARLMTLQRLRSTPGNPAAHLTLSNLDTVLAAAFATNRPSMDHRLAAADFAAAMLYEHDFERFPSASSPLPSQVDRNDDARGLRLDEEGGTFLWRSNPLIGFFEDADNDPTTALATNPVGAASNAVDRPATPASPSRVFSPSVLPDSIPGTLPIFESEIFTIDATGLVATGERLAVTIWAEDPSGADQADVATSVWSRDPTGTGRSTLLARWDDHPWTGPRRSVEVPSADASSHLVDIVITSYHAISELTVNIELEAFDGALVAVTGMPWTPSEAHMFDVGGSNALLPAEYTGVPVDPYLFGERVRKAERKEGQPLMAASLDDGRIALSFVSGSGFSEFDIDSDPATTSPGAPTGISRLFVGYEPRGIGFTHTDGRVLVATEDGLAVVDAAPPVTLEGVLGVGSFGFPASGTGSWRPQDVVVALDDSKAWVSIRGTPWDPAERVYVIDLQTLIGGAYDSTAIIDYIDTGNGTGAWTNPSDLALSPDGLFVAVANTLTDRVGIIDTSVDNVMYDVAPTEAWSQLYVPSPFLPSQEPVSLAWSADSSTVYAGYTSGHSLGSLEYNGVVRKCPLSLGYCRHEVGVEGVVRDLEIQWSGADTIVWVLDANGNITALTDELFEPGQTTSGTDNTGTLDGSGGCTVDWGSWTEAVACPPATTLPAEGASLFEL